MNLSFKIARRYLFAKKSTNAINIITGISVFGISVGTAALVLILSVFNGLGELLTGMVSTFNPDVKVVPISGKTFLIDSTKIKQIKDLKGVVALSKTLEETALFEYEGSQDFGTIKGVDEYYNKVTEIDSTIQRGDYRFRDGDRYLGLIGINLGRKLSIDVGDPFASISVYMAKKKEVAFGNPFKKKIIYPGATFRQQEVDFEYILAPIDFVQSLLGESDKVSALEIKLNQWESEAATLASIKAILGDNLLVKNRYQQEESLYKIMRMEKWISFAILSLTLILVAFNMIGALWMIVLDKKKDITILKSMGASNNVVRNIFLNEGILLAISGMLIGFLISFIFYFLQKNYGLVALSEGSMVDAYPISMYFWDIIAVAAIVLIIGFLASYPPAMRAAKISTFIREE